MPSPENILEFRSRVKKSIAFDIFISLLILIPLSLVFVYTEIFEMWFLYTRAHEDWELDEYFSVFIASLLTGTVLCLRYIFVLRSLIKKLDKTNMQLIEMRERDMRRQKMVALGTLAGGLAHEINNALQPVTGLGQFVHRALDKAGCSKEIEYMNIILDSSQKAQEMIQNVLILSHEKSLEFENVNAFNALYATIELCEAIMPSSVTIQKAGFFEDSGGKIQEAFIRCNKTGLYQIVFNILKNASNAMDDKGNIFIMASITTFPECKTAPAFRVDICDEGPGIPQEIMPKIFDPFFSTKDISEGTGLGLPMVHVLVEQHEGEIRVENPPGGGARFSLYFPLIKQNERVQES